MVSWILDTNHHEGFEILKEMVYEDNHKEDINLIKNIVNQNDAEFKSLIDASNFKENNLL